MRKAIVCVFFFIFVFAPTASAVWAAKELVVTNSEAWPPFSFRGEDGKPRGLLVDIWEEFGRRNDVAVEFRLAPWETTLALVRTGQADVHAGLFQSKERDKYLDYSSAMHVPLESGVFVSRKLHVKEISELGPVPVGVVEKGYVQEFISLNYPSIIKLGYPDSRAVVRAAVDGKILAFVADYPSAMYYLHKSGKQQGFQLVEMLSANKLHAAVRDGDVEMLSFVSAGLKKIPREEYDRIVNKWIQPISMTPDWLYELIFGGLAVLLTLFVFVYVIGLRRQVRQRTCELEKLSQTDMLTGLYNRMHTETILDREVYRAQRYDKPLSVIMLDIDFFKQVNDTFGHSVGDDVLVAFSVLLVENVRKSDSAGRWGGEEFIMICPETDEEQAVALAEKLRSAIESAEFEKVKKCTASFGVTQVKPDEDLNKAFERVDTALYKSKVAGRNRVTRG